MNARTEEYDEFEMLKINMFSAKIRRTITTVLNLYHTTTCSFNTPSFVILAKAVSGITEILEELEINLDLL